MGDVRSLAHATPHLSWFSRRKTVIDQFMLNRPDHEAALRVVEQAENEVLANLIVDNRDHLNSLLQIQVNSI